MDATSHFSDVVESQSAGAVEEVTQGLCGSPFEECDELDAEAKVVVAMVESSPEWKGQLASF